MSQLRNEQDALVEAIKGGFKSDFLFGEYPACPHGWNAVQVSWRGIYIQRARKDGSAGRWVHIGRLADTLQDPAFWQALGKARGWDSPTHETRVARVPVLVPLNKVWAGYAIAYFETILSGCNTKAFWRSLP